MEHFKFTSAYQSLPGVTIGDSSLANFILNNVPVDSTGYYLNKTKKLKILYNRISKNFRVIRRMMILLRVSYDTITIAQKILSQK